MLCEPGPIEDRRDVVARMARTLVHRGPDDEGHWVDPTGQVALGFRRLAILDLTPEGHQPMVSADGRYVVALNGEIYNFAALRIELEGRGHRFRGRSDTEVLLAAVVEWGLGATLERIWGMFAIALWDGRDRVLHLARDRMGKKPLYYGWQGARLLFGSELKALRAHPAFSAPVDRGALASYLRYCYVPSPLSIYQGIHKLPPASWVTFRADALGELPAPTLYWDARAVASAGEASPLQLPDDEVADKVHDLIGDAVRLRAVADVPLGAFLSGGIDSSLTVALLQAQSSMRVRTFTIGYSSTEYDESPHARAIAQHLGTDHTELIVAPEQAQAVIPSLPTLYDEPFADASQVPTFLVSQLARTRVTVALSGDGGDELFGGYNRYVTGTRLWRRLRGLPRPARRALGSLVEGIRPRSWDSLGKGFDRILPRRLQGLVTGNRVHKLASVVGVRNLGDLYLRLVSTWPDPASALVSGREPAGLASSWPAAAGLREPAHQMMLLDLLGYLPDDILVKVDRASMGVSLEARAPLLDHRVAELAWRLPLHQKIRGGEGKWLLRRLLERYVPRTLFDRPKQGFGIPIDAWLRGPLREWAEDLLSERALRQGAFFRPEPLRAMLREHLEGRANRQYQLWAALVFQSWLAAQGSPVAAR